MRNRSDRLRAFCSITIDDDFVVHDLRVIEGRKGYFVAMPSRKLTDNCPGCGSKNELRAGYCNNCGKKLDETRATEGPNARDKFHVDVAHPINTPCREEVQDTVLAAYEAERDRVEQGLAPEREYDAGDLEDLVEDYDGLEPDDEEQEEEEQEVEAPEPAEPEQLEEAAEEEAEEAPASFGFGEPSEPKTEESPAAEPEPLETPPAAEAEEPPAVEEAEEPEEPFEEPMRRELPPLSGEEPGEDEPEPEKEEEEPEPDTGEFGAGIF